MRKPEFIDERVAGCIARRAVDRDECLAALSSVLFNQCTQATGILTRLTNELLFLAQDHTRYEGYMDNPEAHGELSVTRHALYHLVTREIHVRSDCTWRYKDTTFAERFRNDVLFPVQVALAPYFTERATYDEATHTVTCEMSFPDGSTLTEKFVLYEPTEDGDNV